MPRRSNREGTTELKAAVLEAIGEVRVRTDYPEPKVKAGTVKIRVKKTGICESDVHAYTGTHPFRKPPSVLGHEVVGTVVEVGEGVHRFTPGDAVTVMPVVGCGKCHLCREDKAYI